MQRKKTSRILKKLLTYDIGVAFTWYGTKDKRRFCDLQFCQLMCGGLTEQQNKKEAEVTLKDNEKTTMTWLRQRAPGQLPEKGSCTDGAPRGR
ncbi:unnamed protein product [Ixodes persulcatus]